jgi:hypothetical protein
MRHFKIGDRVKVVAGTYTGNVTTITSSLNVSTWQDCLSGIDAKVRV